MQPKETLFSYATKLLRRWKKPSRKSAIATPICKICFKKIETNSWHSLIFGKGPICQKCYRQFSPKMKHFTLLGVKCLALYPYNSMIRSTLYAFKGCGDYELRQVFFAYLAPYLRLRYKGYSIICAPSSDSHNEERGFNHVYEMALTLGLPIIEALRKNSDVKQTTLSYAGRQKVGEIIEPIIPLDFRGKKILFVDDVFTTGATAKACINLIKQGDPKQLKALFMSKVYQGESDE